MDEKELEEIFKHFKVRPTKIAAEYGLVYDELNKCFWFGEKEKDLKKKRIGEI